MSITSQFYDQNLLNDPTYGYSLYSIKQPKIEIKSSINDEAISYEWKKDFNVDPIWLKLQELKLIYDFRNSKQIMEFLLENLYLINFINDIPTEINKFFPESNLSLEIIYDPEYPVDIQLFIIIETTIPLDDAFNRFKELINKFWKKYINFTRDKLGINIEFK